MLLMCDQGAARTTTFTNITLNFILSTKLYFMIIEARLTPKLCCRGRRVYELLRIHMGTGHTVATRLITIVYHVKFVPFVTRLVYVMFSHGPCHVSDDVIVLRHLVKEEIDTLVGLGLSLEPDTIAIQFCIHYLIFAKMFLKSGSGIPAPFFK